MKNILLTLLVIISTGIFSAGNREISTQETKELTFQFNENQRTVLIPVNPQRVVVIGFDTLDIIDSLGLRDRVVGVVDPKGPLFPHYLEGYGEIPSVGNLWGDDLETVAGLKPDLIIAGARTFKNFDSLSEIAPAIYMTIPGMGSPFKEKLFENIDTLSYIFNNESKGEELKSNLNKEISDVNELTSKADDPSALFLFASGKQINLFTNDPKSRYGFVFNEFGFTAPASLEEIENDAASHGNSISYEFISSKAPNYLLVLDRSELEEGKESARDVLDNDLINKTPAAINNNIIYLDITAWYVANGGYKSTLIMLQSIKEALK